LAQALLSLRQASSSASTRRGGESSDDTQVIIRREAAGDIPAIRRVNLAAFPTPGEADLVDALRDRADAFISLVAARNGDIVGHILFTPVTVERPDGSSSPALALGPMAVLPEHQRQGIGSQLVRDGLHHCAKRGHAVVFVLGHPEFYPRFGFTPAPHWDLRASGACPTRFSW